MTNLRCNVVHCEYNSDNHCCRNDIQVSGGREAKSSCETCCDSFKKRQTNSTNSASIHSQLPKQQLNVSCNAASCRFNCSGVCKAQTVDIGGAASSCRSNTVCNTFVRGACPPCR